MENLYKRWNSNHNGVFVKFSDSASLFKQSLAVQQYKGCTDERREAFKRKVWDSPPNTHFGAVCVEIPQLTTEAIPGRLVQRGTRLISCYEDQQLALDSKGAAIDTFYVTGQDKLVLELIDDPCREFERKVAGKR